MSPRLCVDRFARSLGLPLIAAVAVLVGPITAGTTLTSNPGPPAALEQSAAAVPARAPQLAFQQAQSFVRWTPGAHRRPRRILPIQQMQIQSIAGVGRRIFWLNAITGTQGSSLRRVSITGRHLVTLMPHAGPALELAATRRFVTWDLDNSIVRASADGTHVRRRWLVVRRDPTGDMASGMTAHGRFLYISQCVRGRIGRVPLASPHPQVDWIVRGITGCPGDLALGHGFIYWTGSARSGEGVIGRAPVAGGSPTSNWTRIRTVAGPFDVEVVGRFVYWTWGGTGPNGQSFLARVRADHQRLDRKFRKIGNAPITTVSP